MRSVWADVPQAEKPAFKVYRFKKGAWPEMLLGAVMGAARHIEIGRGSAVGDYPSGGPSYRRPNGDGGRYGHVADVAFGNYQQRYVDPEAGPNGNGHAVPSNGHGFQADSNGRQIG